MNNLTDEPKSWAAINGKWTIADDVVSFHGPLKESDPLPHGVALCDLRFRSGKIKARIKFSEKVEGAVGGILFGYDAEARDYYYAGLGGFG